MAGLSLSENKPFMKKETFSPGNIGNFLLNWLIRNKFYFLAFAIPVVIMYVAYAIFKVSPYGDNSVLVLDLNGQYVYYFEAIRDAFWGDESILYNWSRNLSGGYAGIIGYYLASPFTLIPILLPRTMLLGSLQIMILSKLGLASVTFSYYLQKSKGLSGLHATIFSTLYALCAYGVIQAMNPMWLDGVYMLPLIALGIEYLIDDGRKLNLIIPLALIFIFNFYIGYIVAIFTFIYFVFYLFSGRNENGKHFDGYEYFKAFVRFGISAIVAVLCSAFMILSVYKALQLGKFDFTKPDFSFATQFNPLDFFPQLLPAQYDTVDVDGLPEIYCGVLTIVLLPIFYMNPKISLNKKIGYTTLLTVLFLCMYIRPIDMVWHGFQMPNWLPFRYSFTFSFTLLLMGATAFSKIEHIKASAIGATAFAVAALIAITISREAEYFAKWEIAIAAGIASIFCVLFAKFHSNPKLMKTVIPVIIIAVSSGELLFNTYSTFHDEDKSLIYSKAGPWYNFTGTGREVTDQLEQYNYDHGNENDGFFRAEKTFHRTVNDPAALGLKGISHSSSVMNARLLKFLEALGYSASTFYTRYDGNTPISDSLLGIKYSMDRQVVDDPEAYRKTNETYTPIFAYNYIDENDKEAVINVFENENALSLGYMANGAADRITALGNDDVLNSQNIFMSAIMGDIEINENNEFVNYNKYFKPMNVNKDDFILNNVTISPYPTATAPNQLQYTAATEGDPVVNMHITPETDEAVYIYFQTEVQHKVNLWLSTEKDADGNFINHKGLGQYFEDHNYHALNLGKFTPGEEFELRMTVAYEYTIVNNFFFYQFDEKLFQEDMNKLKQNQWNITDFSGDSIEGTVTADVNQLMLTSIPYEEGWTIKVDGETVPFIDKDIDENSRAEYDNTSQCYTRIANALIGIKLNPGEHVIEMSYTPPGLVFGLGALVIGIVCVVFIYRYDKKNNKILIARYRAKNAPKTKSNDEENKNTSDSVKNNTNTNSNNNNNGKNTPKKKKKKKR